MKTYDLEFHELALKDTYKVKLRDVGYRLIYEVIDRRLVIVVIAVGRRDHDAVYLQAAGRSKGP